MNDNKSIIATNILRYMEERNLTASDVCEACGFKQNTFSDWVNGKIYPRIDKIEKMAAYFHINKSNLIEEMNIEPKICKDKIHEAKLLMLSVAKIKEFCSEHECESCPLYVVADCMLNKHPIYWDADEALYRVAFCDGKGRGV